MEIQHLTTKRIDATHMRRYFFRVVPGKPRLLGLKNQRKITVFLSIGATVYDFQHAWKAGQPPHVINIDVPDNGQCSKIEYALLGKSGKEIPPRKVIKVSEQFEDVYEKTLHFERKEDEDSPVES
ncbi:hypothetical protein [Salmonirosea aquatica]|uniref:Uncharacterized protein n=1 Tax=Salmonirosea aquatica TaxID=2654236 RepID=A0A7C9BDY2_9BACT|nr:hypothetical protein [Cytophagaceae bacterium SJW1-29]